MEREIILKTLKKYSPSEFEKFVLDFLLKIENSDFGEVSGKTGDEGIDGYIRLDKLGLSIVPFQAKRWGATSIGRPEIQKFVGALHGRKVAHGVFVTTSSFTAGAKEYAAHVETKIRLIDGKELADLVVRNDLQHLIGEKQVYVPNIKNIFKSIGIFQMFSGFLPGTIRKENSEVGRVSVKSFASLPWWAKIFIILFLVWLLGTFINPGENNRGKRESLFNGRSGMHRR